MAWLTASKLRLTARHDGGRLKQIPFGYPTDRFFAIRCRRRFARCVAWRESLRLRRAMNNAPPSYWTIPRLRAEIEAREGVRISRSQLSKALRKKVPLAAASAHAEGTPDGKRGATGGPAPAAAQTAGRSGRHRSSLRR